MTVDPFIVLFPELVEYILGFLSQDDILSARLVNKTWRSVIESTIIWEKKLAHIIKEGTIKQTWQDGKYKKTAELILQNCAYCVKDDLIHIFDSKGTRTYTYDGSLVESPQSLETENFKILENSNTFEIYFGAKRILNINKSPLCIPKLLTSFYKNNLAVVRSTTNYSTLWIYDGKNWNRTDWEGDITCIELFENGYVIMKNGNVFLNGQILECNGNVESIKTCGNWLVAKMIDKTAKIFDERSKHFATINEDLKELTKTFFVTENQIQQTLSVFSVI